MRIPTSFRSAAVLLVLMTTLIAGGIVPASAQAATPSSDPVPTFTTIQMISRTVGWAVATVPDNDSFRSRAAQDWQTYFGKLAYVLHTEDGGLHWANVMPAPLTATPEGGDGCDCSDNGLAGFFFLDATHAWVMMDDMRFRENQVYDGISVRSTSDGGKSWTTAPTGMDVPYLITSSFVDPTHGWILAGNKPSIDNADQPALLYRTSDGSNWELIADDGVYTHPDDNPNGPAEPVSSPDTGITSLRHMDLAFESARGGWMLVQFLDGQNAYVLHTTDGGVMWTQMDVLNDIECGMSDLKLGVAGEIAFVASCSPEQSLYHSSDNGKSWQSNPIPDNLLNFDGSEMFMLTATTGWAMGCEEPSSEYSCPSAPILYKTSDAGKTWDKIATLPDALHPITIYNSLQYVMFDFVDDQTGWAIDRTGGLMTTVDGGKTWTTLPASVALP